GRSAPRPPASRGPAERPQSLGGRRPGSGAQSPHFAPMFDGRNRSLPHIPTTGGEEGVGLGRRLKTKHAFDRGRMAWGSLPAGGHGPAVASHGGGDTTGVAMPRRW